MGLLSIFKTPNINYQPGTNCFSWNDDVFKFSEIVSFFYSITELHTNGVYTGDQLSLTLMLKGHEQFVEVEVKHTNKRLYPTIQLLVMAIKKSREEQLTDRFDNGKDISFATYNGQHFLLNNKNLQFNNEQIKAITITDSDYSTITIYPSTGSKSISIKNISDYQMFIKLCSGLVSFNLAARSKTWDRVQYLVYGVVFMFAVNSWFSIYTNNEVIEGISIFCGIIAFIWVATMPMYILIAKINNRRKSQKGIF